VELGLASNHKGIVLREATVDDAAAVAVLLDALGYPCEAAEARVRLETVLKDRNQLVLVADRGGEALGLIAVDYLYYLPLGALTCRITAYAVREAWRGIGLGRRLLKEVEARARAKGCARLEVTAAESRTEAHRHYEKLGFRDGARRYLKTLYSA